VILLDRVKDLEDKVLVLFVVAVACGPGVATVVVLKVLRLLWVSTLRVLRG
jgi:hypothetical protein